MQGYSLTSYKSISSFKHNTTLVLTRDILLTSVLASMRTPPKGWSTTGGAIYLGGVQRCVLVGGGMSLGWDLRLQKLSASLSSLYLMLVDQDIASQLLLQCHVCPPAMLPPWWSWTLTLWCSKLPGISFFYKLPWCLITAIEMCLRQIVFLLS